MAMSIESPRRRAGGGGIGEDCLTDVVCKVRYLRQPHGLAWLGLAALCVCMFLFCFLFLFSFFLFSFLERSSKCEEVEPFSKRNRKVTYSSSRRPETDRLTRE